MKGETRPCYLLTKKGCDMVANKMIGDKGILFTAEYVTAFENMKDIIQSNPLQLMGEIEELKKGLEEVKQYYRLPHSEKLNLNKRIKSRLGTSHTKEEIEDVKEYVFMNTGIEKWEDLPIQQRITVIDLIDRRCKIIVESRKNLFNWNKL